MKLCDPNFKFISNSFYRPKTDEVYITAKHVRRYGLPDVDTESSEEDESQLEVDDSDDEDVVSNTGSTSRSWCKIS